jgi:ADP-heptose:LPS heptosyltransferase
LANTSHNVLEAVRRGEKPPTEELRKLGEETPTEFFRDLIEPLCDSFLPADAEAYESIMRAWIKPLPPVLPIVPDHVETAYVLSRVTLGADVKVASLFLDAAKKRFVDARVVFVGGRKSAELFANDSRVEHLEVDYPRSAPVSERIRFAHELSKQLTSPRSIVIDPDSRITQLGLIPVGAREHYFHFPSRTTPGGNLVEIAQAWAEAHFGVLGQPYIAPKFVEVEGESPWVAVSLGVGGNMSKRIDGTFEADLIARLASHYRTVWLDRGAGGEEAERVTAAAAGHDVRFWEGSFAGFASVIAQSDLYVGYDSAGQHAAAAVKTPVISIFAGSPSERFRERWAPGGYGPCTVIDADTTAQDQILARIPIS